MLARRMSIPPTSPSPSPRPQGADATDGRTPTHGRELSEAVRSRIADQWYAENREGVDSWNAYLKEHGMPFEDDSLF